MPCSLPAPTVYTHTEAENYSRVNGRRENSKAQCKLAPRRVEEDGKTMRLSSGYLSSYCSWESDITLQCLGINSRNPSNRAEV